MILVEAISLKNIEKYAELMVTLLNKKLGKNYTKLQNVKYVVEDGRKGQGVEYIDGKTGELLRLGFLQPKTKAKTIKDKFILNDISFWVEENGKIDFFGDPTYTLELMPWNNAIQNYNDIIAFVKSGYNINAVDSIQEKLFEAHIIKKLVDYWNYKTGGEPIPQGVGTGKLKTIMKERGLFDEEEYRGFKVVKNRSEDNTIKNDLREAENKFNKIPEDYWSDPIGVFKDIEDLTKVVIYGGQKSLIIAGDPGVGKTYHVTKVLKEELGEPNKPDSKWFYYQGLKASPFGVYKILYQNRDNKIIVFDDSDSVLKDPDVVNMFKAALDSGEDVREINWTSNLTVNVDLLDNPEEYLANLDAALRDPSRAGQVGTRIKLPSRFKFTSSVIFISNLPKSKFDTAIQSRSLFVEVRLSKDGMIERIKYLVAHMYPEIPLEEKLEMVDKLAESNGQVTVRSVIAAIKIKSVQDKLQGDVFELIRKYT